jgi:peptidoglycan/LPS O-acetylase OafA/YrhL
MGLLRFLLAISVLQSHISNPGFGYGFGGSISVELFFLISGYFVSSILVSNYADRRKFFASRFLRLYPQYFIILILIALRFLAFPEYRVETSKYPRWVETLSVIPNLTFVGSDWMMFFGIENFSLVLNSYESNATALWGLLWVPQIWSLGIEVTFYAFAPFLCKLRSGMLIVLVFVLVLLRLTAILSGLNYDPWTYRFFPFEMPLFIVGILIHRNRSNLLDLKFEILKSPKFLYLNLILAFILMGYFQPNSEFGRLNALVVLIIFVVIPIMLSSWSSFDRSLGELSYPIYICHIFVFQTLSSFLTVVQDRGIAPQFFKHTILWNIIIIAVLSFSKFLIWMVSPIEKFRAKLRKSN